MYYEDEFIKLYCGDARELSKQVENETVDLIFTDPPYKKEYLYLYEWLGKESYRILKPNKFLFAYAGPYHKQETMQYLGEKLNYYWDFILKHNGNTTILWPRKIISMYKSILCYQKGNEGLPKTNVLGLFEGAGSDKRFHKWGQEEYSAKYYIDCFTNEGDLVIDPFVGGGTTPVVCKRLRRKCIAFEIDEDVFEIAKDRIKFQNVPQKYDQLSMKLH